MMDMFRQPGMGRIPGGAATNVERTLLDALDRSRRNPHGRAAIHLHLSRLQPAHRTAQRLRLVVQLFRPMEVGLRCQIYTLHNGDVVLLTFDIGQAEQRRMVHRVRALFEDDPLAYDEPEDGHDQFADIYDLTTNIGGIERTIGRLLEMAEDVRRHPPPARVLPDPIDPRRLAQIHDRLNLIDLGPFLTRQPAIVIDDARRATIAFEEMFVAVGELQAAIAPDTDLAGDRWLFQDLSRRLDRLALQRLARTASVRGPWNLSVNLNLETLSSPVFADFVGSLNANQRVIVEVQVIDVYNNIGRFQSARDLLRARGHAIAVDGITPTALRLLDLTLLDADHVKVLWSADLDLSGNPRLAAQARKEVEHIGPDRVILARCDTEHAVQWGLSLGITTFQGRFIDAMVSVATMQDCPGAPQCTLAQCAARRRSVAGPVRLTCPHPPGLSAVQAFQAPQIRRRTRAKD